MKLVPYKIVNQDGKPYIQVKIKDGQTKVFSPEEISAMILTKMKDTTEAFLGKKELRTWLSQFQCGCIVPRRSGTYISDWGMDLSKVVVFIGENGTIGYEGNLGGVHKSIILKGVSNAINDQHHAMLIDDKFEDYCDV
ncbi:putative Heat shock protein 70 family [Helianthus anomalus]